MLKKLICFEKFQFKISEYNREKIWFSVENRDGGTCKHPYSPMSKQDLKDIIEALNDVIKTME